MNSIHMNNLVRIALTMLYTGADFEFKSLSLVLILEQQILLELYYTLFNIFTLLKHQSK